MNILITGADGFIGSNLVRYLNKKHNIFNLVLKRVKNKNIKNQLVIDLTGHDRVKDFFKKFRKEQKVDVIIHLAARLTSADSVDDTEMLYSNLRIAEGLVTIEKLLRPKKIINFSSIAVYPNKNGIYNEFSEIKPSVNPDCIYGLSKFCSENILDYLLRKEKIAVIHLRISNVYGREMREDRVIPMMIKELKENNIITVFGEGKRISNFIEVGKLSEAVGLFLKRNVNGVFNLGAENLSYLDLAKRIIRQYGNNKSKIIKLKKGSQVKFYLDTSKIEKLGIKPIIIDRWIRYL